MVVAPSPLQELAEAVEASDRFVLGTDFKLSSKQTLKVSITGTKAPTGWWGYLFRWTISAKSQSQIHLPRIDTNDIGTILRGIAADYPKATLLPESIEATVTRGPLGAAKLVPIIEQAWHEAYGLPIPSLDDLAARRKRDKEARKTADQEMVALLTTGPDGVEEFNKRPRLHRLNADLRKADLTGRMLDGVEFTGANLEGADFTGASLVKAEFGEAALAGRLKQAKLVGANLAGANFSISRCAEADFSQANLTGAKCWHASFLRARFVDADLSQVDFMGADLRGADFTGAKLAAAKFRGVKFDETTRWPDGFAIPANLEWKGNGPDPRLAPTPAEIAKGRPADFAGFVDRLGTVADPSKLDKALSMLKADRFRLFARVEADHVTGVVKSQSDGSLVYSCRLGADGSYACCTQNLNICGGLRGSPCKHLLVLIVGLTQAGELDPGTAHDWTQSSRGRKPALDKDAMTETFLRFKGAEAGEVDWRPTETIPEDFYAI